jgi:DNA mismatch repair protein MutS2
VQVTEVAGAPFSFEPAAQAAAVAQSAALDQIEFRDALEVVAKHAVSDGGAARVLARRPVADRSYIEGELALVAAMLRLFQEGDRFRPAAVSDVSEALGELAVPGSVLDGPALIGIAQAVSAMREVESEVRRVADEEPLLGTLAQPVPDEDLARSIERAVEPDGSLKDDASPDLAKARRTLRSTRDRLVRLLEQVASQAGEGEGGVTMRNGRYVVPVRRETRGRVDGIVHDESSSGATLFVEPQQAVGLANELNACEAAERRAALAVLRGLTDHARRSASEIRSGWEMCIVVDDVYARARYADACAAVPPAVVDAPATLHIVHGRHPVLLDRLEQVVPFDLTLGGDETLLVISGPNTGGKTVLLKAVGLLVALTQAGIVPPVGGGTIIPVHGRIFADIGDHQSLSESLSTFSGHLEALKRILEAADERALILLDEFGTGTDPSEGAALAGAVLQTLCARRTLTLATTHLGQIKMLAARTPGAVNASLHFDPDRLEPTYRFQRGVPGRSYGLAIAKRLGFPDDVLGRAETLRPDAERTVDALLADLERREHELSQRESEATDTEARLVAERDGLNALREELTAQSEQVRDERKRLEASGREEARRYLLEARKRVEEALGTARAAVTEVTAKEARRLVEQGIHEEADALRKLEEEARKKGWTVRREGAGGSRTRGRDEPDTDANPHPARRRRGQPAERIDTPTLTEVDLRGMTADEAEEAVVRALDEAIVEDAPSLRIIHGKGTGALRSRVTSVLERDRRVPAFRPGGPTEGGWGVTVVEFKT